MRKPVAADVQGNRPFIFINTAMTADGKIDTMEQKGAAISSPSDKERVDRLRAGSDAVMVGGRTLLQEDPRLTVRSGALRAERLARGEAENPAKVGIVSRIVDPEEGPTIRSDGKFLNSGPARVVVFTTEQTAAEQIARIREHGATVIVAGERRVDLPQAMQHLRDLGIRRLMVEGGGTLNAALLKLRLVDEINLYIAPLIFGGAAAPTPADGLGLTIDEALHLELTGLERLEGGGIVVQYSVHS